MVALHMSRNSENINTCILITFPPQAFKCSVSDWQDALDNCFVFTGTV